MGKAVLGHTLQEFQEDVQEASQAIIEEAKKAPEFTLEAEQQAKVVIQYVERTAEVPKEIIKYVDRPTEIIKYIEKPVEIIKETYIDRPIEVIKEIIKHESHIVAILPKWAKVVMAVEFVLIVILTVSKYI